MKQTTTKFALAATLLFAGLNHQASAQILGSAADVTTSHSGGIVLAGGGQDNDAAMKWMLTKAAGGDVVVIRAAGDDAYNAYLFNLGPAVNSVETIVISSRTLANQTNADKIRAAEALFITGGDQANYVNFWKDTPVEDAINYLINTKGVVIGGTSAGCAIQGKTYFDALNGTITSATALANPYANTATIQRDNFLSHSILSNTITDTHYDNPDRKGRHVTFLARMVKDWAVAAKGIGVDEHTAVCIEPNGTARVFGDAAYDDNVYFLQSYGGAPETCVSGSKLTWNRGTQAVKVYKIKGEVTGSNTFNLNTWTSGTGGIWEDYYVANGVFAAVSPSSAPSGGGGTTCNVPTGLAAGSITNTSATLSWASSGATSYSVRYKATASATWTTTSSATTSLAVSGLTAATAYEFQVSGVCASSSSAFSVSTTFITSSGSSVTYCAITGYTNSEWIDNVTFAGINNTSGNNGGYANFTSQVATIKRGTAYTFSIKAAYSGSVFTEYTRVWIDYNQDGDFVDAGEQVLSISGKNTRTGTITIPSTALLGSTRMRVTMRYGGYATNCTNINWGEGEDYTVQIGAAKEAIITQEERIQVSAYPNPAHHTLTLAWGQEPAIIAIYNMEGKQMAQFAQVAGEQQINVSDWANGHYVVQVRTASALQTKKVVIVH